MELEMNPARTPTTEAIGGKLSLLALVVAALLIFSSFALIVSTLLGLQLGHALLRPNPFAAYEGIWPGQSISSLAAHARGTPEGKMLCRSGIMLHDQYPSLVIHFDAGTAYGSDMGNKIVCTAFPSEGVFRSMSVTVENDQVQELTLFSDSLHQDSLFLYWGAPDAITSVQDTTRLYLHWNRDTYEAMAAVLEADYMVDFVTLTKQDAPG
jgi:hypothetical protein